MGDDKLSCKQLAAEIQEANEFESKAQKEKGITGTNVAAAVIFGPRLLGHIPMQMTRLKLQKSAKNIWLH